MKFGALCPTNILHWMQCSQCHSGEKKKPEKNSKVPTHLCGNTSDSRLTNSLLISVEDIFCLVQLPNINCCHSPRGFYDITVLEKSKYYWITGPSALFNNIWYDKTDRNKTLAYYFNLGWDPKYCDQRVCPHAYLKKHVQTSKNNFCTSVHVTCGHGSVPLWRHCNTLCTFSFVDYIMFSHNRPSTDRLGVCHVVNYSPWLTTWHHKLCTWGQSLLLLTAWFKNDKKINKFLHDRCLANIHITSSMSGSTNPNEYCIEMSLLSDHYL